MLAAIVQTSDDLMDLFLPPNTRDGPLLQPYHHVPVSLSFPDTPHQSFSSGLNFFHTLATKSGEALSGRISRKFNS